MLLILKWIEKLERYQQTYGRSFEEFEANEDYQNLCSFALIQIAEHSDDLSTEFRCAHEEIDWASVYGMRCFLVHGYEGVNQKLVWESVTLEIPVLKEFCLCRV